jgi:hypothetical protein
MDPLDKRLAEAGRFLRDEAELTSALVALGGARAEVGRRRRRRRLIVPVLAPAVALTLAGAGGVVASQWGPWHISDADIVITRHWSDVTGAELGTCQSRIRAAALPEDTRAEVRAYLDSVDVDVIEPAPEYVEYHLTMAGRPEDIGRLVKGAHAEPVDAGGEESPGNGASDARVLQGALVQTLAHEMFLQAGVVELSSEIETQCSDDPTEGRS